MSPIATKPPFLEEMEHGQSLPPDVEDAEVWDDSREGLPTPSASSNGQNPEEKASPSSTNTAEHVTPSTPIATWLSSTQSSSLYYRVLVLLFLFAFWRSLSYSVSIRTVSSSNQFGDAKGGPHSNLRCNPLFCYSASFSIRKSEGLWPSSSPQIITFFPPILKRCVKSNKIFNYKTPNGRDYKVMCSDAIIQASTDINGDGAGAALSCLARCISDNYACEGVLYLVDRPFERNCFFQHHDERPVFGADERVLGAELSKD